MCFLNYHSKATLNNLCEKRGAFSTFSCRKTLCLLSLFNYMYLYEQIHHHRVQCSAKHSCHTCNEDRIESPKTQDESYATELCLSPSQKKKKRHRKKKRQKTLTQQNKNLIVVLAFLSHIFILPYVHRQLNRLKPKKTLSSDKANLIFSRQLCPFVVTLKSSIVPCLHEINQKERNISYFHEKKMQGSEKNKHFSGAYE